MCGRCRALSGAPAPEEGDPREAAADALADDPYTLTCAGNTCSITQNFDFGNPIPVLGPGATTSIGITIQSPGQR
jgi:hypothetical protein